MNKSVREIWLSNKAKKIRDFASTENRICKGCNYLATCGSFCMAENYLQEKRLIPKIEYFKNCKKPWESELNLKLSIHTKNPINIMFDQMNKLSLTFDYL